MEKSQRPIRQLLAFSAVVLLCAGLPHLLFDRGVSNRRHEYRPAYSPEALFPPEIGEFHRVDLRQNTLPEHAVEEFAVYRDADGGATAQFSILINLGEHNGATCYLARGMKMQWEREERVQTADSAVNFEIISITDRSVAASGGSSLLLASTGCTETGCEAKVPEIPTRLRLGWTRANSGKEIDPETRDPIDFSITFQSLEQGGGGRDQQASQEESLLHFRRLMESFRLDPVRDMASRQ